MAKFVDVHPVNPQPHRIGQAVALLRDGGVIAYPTDSSYALGCMMNAHAAVDRIRAIRGLDERQPLTLVCADFGQLGQLVHLGNAAFRAIKAATPGPYTFILQATKEVPRRLSEPKRRTVGVRIPDHPVVHELLSQLGEPMVSSTLQLPGEEMPMTDGWTIKEELDHRIDAVIDAGECGTEPSTVIDYSDAVPSVVRVGVGDPSPFE